eukprot:3589176-Prymnesium_polylepis.1
MAQLQVQAHTHRLSDLRCERLWLVRPREAVEVDEHVVACAQISPRLYVGNLEEPRPGCIQFLRELSHPRVVLAAVHLDGEVSLR